MAYLEVSHLSFSYKDTPVLDDVSLSCKKGQCIALMGPSGSGKTTFLRILAGLIIPDQGTITLDGSDITNLKPEERGVSMIFQEPSLFPHTKVKDNIAYGLRKQGYRSEEIEAMVYETARLLKIEDQLNKYPGALSGGQAQRAGIARALIRKTKLLLCDEPFSSLDQDLKQELMEEIRTIQQIKDITMIVVTHDKAEADYISDQTIQIQPINR